ncbi:golgi membrane protein [Purpureocillium lavendulum]|uniref:Protein CASP n=1 Tax=Purpureocillium lavendulum TaxID=1247861 RepID=A0AB34FZX9_9HYPO|nr:golgi membrane protein [Purpureocillium lavendulum]
MAMQATDHLDLGALTDQPQPAEATAADRGFEGGNKFQHAISSWRNLDLTTLTGKLDNTASEIVAYQRDSTVQRKDLAQKTKDFKKLDDSTKLVEIKGLLKAYQTFIDHLTNHSKSVNSAFSQAYTSLSDVPDPYPLLEASVDSMLVSEETLPKLTEENQHLQKNVSKLTTQLEETESKLQAERSARRELEDNLESRVKEVESSWTAVLEEKKDNWDAKEKSLVEKLENQDRLLNEMRASYEVNQRLGKNGEDQDAQRGRVSSAELEMLHSDLERTSSRLAEVEARNEQMRLELAQAKSSASSQPEKLLEDDPGYMRMRSENSSLIRKLDTARLEREGLKRDLDSRVRSMEREVSLLKDERESLRAKVQKWSDYDDIKQELEVLKSIEFSTGDDDDVREKIESEAGGDKGDSLEKLLLLRNKKLGDELTILRVSHQDLQSRLEDLQEELSRTNAELEKSQNLTEKLENDLENMQAEGANAFPSGASVAGTYVTRAQTRRGRASPTSSIISGLDPRAAPGEREPMGGGSGILPMVTAQRDRFKTKNAQLEQELSDTHRTVQQLRQEVAALQKDNLNLYEKTRYVSTYSRGGATTSSSSAYASNPNPSTVSIGGTGHPGISLDRYQKAYESNISPFAAFRGRESARAYRRMSFPERVVYSITRMVLASRTSRNLFAAYCVVLHIVVFFSLYWLGSADFEKHASNLGSAAAAAAAAGAGGSSGGSGGSLKGGAAHGNWKEDGFSGQ